MKTPPPPMLFRIVGKSRDGLVVTLGKYTTRDEAEQDLARLSKDAFYRDMKISAIAPPAPNPT